MRDYEKWKEAVVIAAIIVVLIIAALRMIAVA